MAFTINLQDNSVNLTVFEYACELAEQNNSPCGLSTSACSASNDPPGRQTGTIDRAASLARFVRVKAG
jgi:hypothetical protein